VRDVFRVAQFRLGLMLTEDDPAFANWDQDETAVSKNYARLVTVRRSALNISAETLRVRTFEGA
jgi:hypothetical protein